jgi:hypothetical protein
MTDSNRSTDAERNQAEPGQETKSYLRFIAMIVTAMVVMYATTYVNTFELSHVQYSETRVFMTLLMGATMALVMLGFMLGMYRNWKANLAIVVAAIALFGLATWLVRSQTTVQEESYMSAMIPHHSIAILTSERTTIEDVRVCELAVAITEAQRREISEMEWLIADIAANGPADSRSEADQRPVPPFEGTSSRECS